MSTKSLLQLKIDRLENDLKESREQVKTLQTTVKHLEMERDNTYPDYPLRNTMPWPSESHRWTIARNALEARLDSLKTCLERNYGTAEQGLGIALSIIFHYCGDNVILAGAYGCEDANWHSDAATLFALYERNISRYNDPDPSPEQQNTVNWWAD